MISSKGKVSTLVLFFMLQRATVVWLYLRCCMIVQQSEDSLHLDLSDAGL